MGNSGSTSRYYSAKEAVDIIGISKCDEIRYHLQKVTGSQYIDFNAFQSILQVRFDKMVRLSSFKTFYKRF